MAASWRNWLAGFHVNAYARRQPLVLINGLAEQAESWFRNLPFWRRHFDVHMPNLLVYDGPALHQRIEEGLSLSVGYLVEQLHLYLESFVQSPPYHFVAASLGGKIAVEYAVRYPANIARLVLLCPSGMGDGERLPIVEGVRRNDPRAIVECVFHDAGSVDPRLLLYYQRQFTNRRWRLGLLRTVRGTMDHCVRDRMTELSQPTLLVSGRNDKIVDPRFVAAAAKLLPRGHYLSIPQCGHAPQMERPWLTNRLVLHFLTSARPNSRPPMSQLLLARPILSSDTAQAIYIMANLSVLETLAARPTLRRLTDVFMGRFAAHRTAQLNRHPASQSQQRTLLRLVRHARHTRFGIDHDFDGIRTVSDYQRRVPLRTYENFWGDYWRSPFPYLADVTWPGAIPYFALSSGTTSGTTKYIPLSRAMLASNQKAALTTLALFLATYPGTPLFTGRLFFLGGSTVLRDLSANGDSPPSYPVLAGDLSGITVREASPLLRPFTFPPVQLALVADWDEKMRLLAQSAVRLPITMLSGIPSWLLVLFDRLRQQTGRERIADIWPGLRLLIHGGIKFDPYREVFQRIIGDSTVRFLETYPASEGFIATEDPRYDLLRLIPDHNIFYEFVPVADLDAKHPARHCVSEVVTGVPYAIVLSTCAGLWSYVLGDTVCFERRDPPLLRFTGRTRYFLSVFGEHVISDEVEKAVARACTATGVAISDFHVGPWVPDSPNIPGRHRWFIEFTQTICPDVVARFARELDSSLGQMNEDYAAHRQGNLAMMAPEIILVPHGGFADWMRSRGRLGGQHKVPRLDNSGEITGQLARFFHVDV